MGDDQAQAFEKSSSMIFGEDGEAIAQGYYSIV